MNYRLLTAGGVLALSACAGMPGVEMGSQSAKTVATGSAGGSTAANANAQLERCGESLGTLSVIEDQRAPWYYQLRNEYKLQSTVPLIRLLVQQSNCFVVVERGERGMNAMSQERILEASGWREIAIEPIDIGCTMTASELETYFTRLGPVGGALPEADAGTRSRILDAVRPAFAPYVQGDAVRFTAACWQIGARN